MLITDSREKKNAHILAYFDRHNIEYEVKKLDVGDYMYEGGAISVDRKQNLDEVAHNLMNKSDKSRFWKEVRRARDKGIRLIVLCEHGGKIHSIKDVANWHSKYSPVSGTSLMNEIYRVHIAYNIDFLFCDKRSTGRRIVEILSCNQQE